ncbi:NACHT and WD domain protein [Coniochaeta sp. PMI_546]|nr:NACHT and WD domain protein [Coniochaeta sp. PMI_546]
MSDRRHPNDTPSSQGNASLLPQGISPRGSYSAAACSDLETGVRSSEVEATPSIPLVKKRFTLSWAQKRRNKDDKGSRGPLGLRILHSSPEPLVDLIFVHGLRGGSIKTWRKGDDPRLFWPQFWLPVEPGFRNVNIHSFGYDSDWASTKSSILNIHDFGQSLLEEMRNSPHLRCHDRNAPIILIGHSMGGLVIKKAYNLARDVLDFRDRIRCIFFLATPHRGSDYAAILNNILTMTGILSSRDYIKDLTTGSRSAQLINDEFGKYAHVLPIFSFYETLRMNLGLSSTLIVKPDSAVLGAGFENERCQLINANHRDICKFDSPDDPNYITLRNALSTAVQDILKDLTVNKERETKKQLKALRSLLIVSDRPDEHYQKVDGSCQWLDDRDDFQEWRDGANDTLPEQAFEVQNSNPSIIWVHARPGTGKTVLAAHVISQLQEFQVECAYYYFHVGNKTARTLADLLRSLAYQMAMSNAAIREKLVDLCREGATFDLDDDLAIWTKVFRKCILQARVYTPQYWVIDAIDECSRYQEFLAMLKGEKPNFPLRIFVTSRNIPDMARLYRRLEASMAVVCIEIPLENSMRDIERYIDSRIESLPLAEESDRVELARTILNRSDACFLWVRLVLDELDHVYSTVSILRVLQGIPDGMIPFYERTTKAMAENRREKHITKAVLLWVVASSRKMSITELSQALQLDIQEDLPSVKSAIEGLCGQLVSVDEKSGMVEFVHSTVHEFLLSEAAGEFRISKLVAHEKMAMSCLRLLTSREMKPPRGRHASIKPRVTPSPLLDYAMSHFSEHIHGASLENDELLMALDQFLKTNVLSWVERVTLKGDIHCLIRTSRDLKAYLDRRAKYHSTLSSRVGNIDLWAADLSRIVTKFGTALTQKPSSIYFDIPPLCPPNSAIYRQFGERPDGLAIVGFKSNTWDDCIAFMSLGEGKPVAASCGESLIAIGMGSRDVTLYNHQSCQKEGVLRNKWPVDIVHFTDGHVAISTVKTLVLQDLKGNTIWETRLRSRCILLTSSGDTIYAVSQRGQVLRWSIQDGTLHQEQSFEYRNHDAETDYNRLKTRVPAIASVSPDMEILALGYLGGTVCLWDLLAADFIGWARDEDDKLPAKMLFNPNPNINLLLVLYTNHDLALFDTWSGSRVNFAKPPKHAGVLSASCAPDGRTFVTGDTLMQLQIWDFGSLSLLYHLDAPFATFRILNFTSDGSSIVDVTDSGMRIWSPAVLVRKETPENESASEDAIELTVAKGQYEPLRSARITAMGCHPSSPVVFAGKSDGQVIASSTKTGQQVAVLYTHPQAECVTQVTASKSNLIASCDGNGVVLVYKCDLKKPATSYQSRHVFRTQPRDPVKQLCFCTNGDYLLVSSALSDRVYATGDGSHIGTLPFAPQQRETWRWSPVADAGQDQQFMLIQDQKLVTFSAAAFPSRIEGSSVNLRYDIEGRIETSINSAVLQTESRMLVVDVQHESGFVSSSTMFLFNLASLRPANGVAEDLILDPLHSLPPAICHRFVGISKGRFVFVHRNAWLSSTDVKSLASKHYAQHFFVPNEYISSRHDGHNDVRPVITADEDVVFCLYGELVIVKNGLRFQDIKELEFNPRTSPKLPHVFGG